MTTKRFISAVLLSACSLHAEGKAHKFYKASVAAFVAGNALDTASSFGPGRETNPLLARGGQFTAGSAGIKLGIASGILVGEYFLMRKHPELEKPLGVANFGIGAALTGVAIHNMGMK